MIEVNKTIVSTQKFQFVLPRSSLVTIYKAFVRFHLNCSEIIFDQALNNSFHQKKETAAAITEVIRETPKEELHQKLQS